MNEKRKAIGKLLMERTTDQMQAVAERYGMITQGKIDLRGETLRFNHSGIDLRCFLIDACDLSGSVLTNVVAEGVSFSGCVLKRVRIVAEKGQRASFRDASFSNALLQEAVLGPRTLDLAGSSYRNAKLTNVAFNMGKLNDANFENAELADVYFRSAELNRASFRDARLTRVSFERAMLEGADFGGARFAQMEQWGEPNFDGAIIEDDLRYRYGIVTDPLKRLDALIENDAFGPDEVEIVRSFREKHREFLSNSQVMLIASEYEGEIETPLFVKMLKALKKDAVQ